VAFNNALGYNLSNADILVENIRQNIKNYPAEYKGNKGYGDVYTISMVLKGLNGKTANVMTSWLDDKETGEIRLTSAYVKKRRDIND